MSNIKKILIGMSRPNRKDCGGKDFHYYHCRCMDPTIARILRSGSRFEICYQSGHFDEPIYKYVWEEDGKIIESLTEPKKEG